MNELNPFDEIKEIKPQTDAHLPPLSISHLLMFMTAIAIALSFHFSGRSNAPIDRYQIGQDYITTINSIGVGIALAFVVWLFIRRCRGKSIELSEPGAWFALLVAFAQLIAILGNGCMFVAFQLDIPQIPFYFASLFAIIGVFALGFVRIEDKAWRVAIVTQALGSIYFAFPLTALVSAIAIVYSVNRDQRAKVKRHWTHHLGIFVWLFSQGFPILW